MITKKHKEMPQILTVNKKIAIIPSVIIVVIIVGISQVSLDYTPEQIPEVEIVEEIENMIIMPVKSARPDCGPNDECYIPSYYLAKIDETVYWINEDSAFHSVTSGQQENPDGLFDSGHIDPDEKFSYTFTEPGVYSYYCTLHPWMNGMIKVER
jgi:plastocyanin|tara:strand:- start:1515 stop:1976 length:462 start_codon:yes stop_codon:yes gene_type:complete